MTEAVWEMWDEEPDEPDDDDYDPDACPECERAATWDGGICFCDHCGYIGDGQGAGA